MSQTTLDTADSSSNSQTSQSFADALKQARNAKKWTIEMVADELKILKRHVVAIEEQDFESLPDFAFARGFVVNYAKLMQLDPHDIAKRFEQSYPAELKPDNVANIKSPLQPMGTLHRGRSPLKLNFGLIAAIIGVLLLGIAILRMINGATSNDDTAVMDSAQLSVNEQAVGAALDNNPNATTVGTGSAIGTATAVGTGSALGVAGSGRVDFWVKGTTNIHVTDATGAVLLTGEQTRGGREVTGQPPFNITIDDASKVDLNYNHSPIRLADHTTDGKATLTLQ